MIKKSLKMMAIAITTATMLTSCYSYTTVVGEGAQGNKETKAWNHYVIFGLAPVGVSNPAEIANGAKDYTVTTKQTFVNGLIAAITFGIYTPTMTTITQ